MAFAIEPFIHKCVGYENGTDVSTEQNRQRTARDPPGHGAHDHAGPCLQHPRPP